MKRFLLYLLLFAGVFGLSFWLIQSFGETEALLKALAIAFISTMAFAAVTHKNWGK